MNAFREELQTRLDAIRRQGLWRELRELASPQGVHVELAGRRLRNFSSNDYLGLAGHPTVRAAAAQAANTWGAGAGASRLICGSLGVHHELERALAAFKGTASALVFGSGHAAALGTLPALVGSDDVVLLDKLVHACLVDAARLSGAKLRVFAHNDLNDLDTLLRWATETHFPRVHSRNPEARPRALIVTESVFSMDGDHAPLRAMVELKERHAAWLMVDEAHATGLYGAHRRGLAEAVGVAEQIEVQLGTLGKALGSAGGYIAGPRELCDFLVNRARSFIFSTAPVPAAVAAAGAAVQLVQGEEGAARVRQLGLRTREFTDGLQRLGWTVPDTGAAIVPLVVGAEAAAMDVAMRLRERGFLVPAIRYPTVARGTARLRVTLSAAHTGEDVAALLEALADCLPAPPASATPAAPHI